VKRLVWIAGLAAALVLAGSAGAGGQAYLSWTLGQDGGKPTVTWKITGSTKWYLGVIEIGTRATLNGSGDFPTQNVVAYDVLPSGQSSGTWQLRAALPAGTYYGLLTLRYDGPCDTGCESHSSVRSFTVPPPRLRGLVWTAAVRADTVSVTWKKPRGAWYVGIVLVDDSKSFASPVDADTRPLRPTAGAWKSRKLGPGTYYVRLRLRYGGCDTCLATRTKKVHIG
jgi:hypothetical protein